MTLQACQSLSVGAVSGATIRTSGERLKKCWPNLYLEINLHHGKRAKMRFSEAVNEEYMHNKERVVPIALAIITAAYCVLFFYFVVRAKIWIPVSDTIDWILSYGYRLQAGDWVGYLWAPFNEHRIVWSRILIAIDVTWFDGPGPAFAFFGLLLVIAMVATVCWEIQKSDFSNSLKATAIPIAILLLLPANTVVNIGMPIYCGFMHTAVFALFSLVLLDGAAEQGPFSNYRRAAAIAAACLAAFGVSGGLLIWPVLIWSAWKGGLRWNWIAVIACIGGIFCALYVHGLHSSYADLSFNLAALVKDLDYAIRFLGLPWSHAHQLVWPARLVGGGILCLGGFFLIKDSLSGDVTPRLERFGLALVLFTLLLAAAAAFARSDFGEDRETPIRYGELLVLAHVGLLLCSLGFLQRVWCGAYRRSFQWLALGISIALLGQQIVAGRLAVKEADQYKESWSRFVAGDWTPEMPHYVYWDRDEARAKLAYFRTMQIPHGE